MSESRPIALLTPEPVRLRIEAHVMRRLEQLVADQPYWTRLQSVVRVCPVNRNGWNIPTAHNDLIAWLVRDCPTHMEEIGCSSRGNVILERTFSVARLLDQPLDYDGYIQAPQL